MEFTFMHNNFNVLDIGKSVAFYNKALGLQEAGRFAVPDGSFIIIFLSDGRSSHQLELTWLKEHTAPYDLGDNETHLAMSVDDIEAARKMHKEMGCVCFENTMMGIYFIEDPDGYWIEIIPAKK
jgi:lactoylglutathione lyase